MTLEACQFGFRISSTGAAMLRTIIGISLVVLTAAGCGQGFYGPSESERIYACKHLDGYVPMLAANTGTVIPPVSPGDRLDTCGSKRHVLTRVLENGLERLSYKDGISLVVVAVNERSVVARVGANETVRKDGRPVYVLLKDSDAYTWRREAILNESEATEKNQEKWRARAEIEWAKDVVRKLLAEKK